MVLRKLPKFMLATYTKGQVQDFLLDAGYEQTHDFTDADFVVFTKGPAIWPGLQLDPFSVKGMAPVRDLLDLTIAHHAMRERKYLFGLGARGAQLVNIVCGGKSRVLDMVRKDEHKSPHMVADNFFKDAFKVGSDHAHNMEAGAGATIMVQSQDEAPVVEVVGYPFFKALAFMPEVCDMDNEDYIVGRGRAYKYLNELMRHY